MYSSQVNPLFHTPAAITRSITDVGRSKTNTTAMLAVTLFMVTSVSNRPNYRIIGTNGLKARISSLEKTLQLHPSRSDIRLEIMKIRTEIREIESENKKHHTSNK